MTIFKLRTAATPTQTLSSALFLTLPVEIRHQIYHYTLSPQQSKSIPLSAVEFRSPFYSRFLPTLCQVNKATRIDVGLWYIHNTELIILYTHSMVYFSQFLSTFPDIEGFKALRRLDLQLFGRHRPTAGRDNVYISFMRRCPNLTQIRIKFEIWHLLKTSPTKWLEDDPAMKILDNIEYEFGLYGLFEMKSLAKLTIEVFPKTIAKTSMGVKVVVPNCWPAMERVAKWMRGGFRARGRSVDVELMDGTSSGLRYPGAVQQ